MTRYKLKADNLRLKYPGQNGKIFDGLNIAVEKGEKVLLLGPSGCGKSTLLNVLSGIVPHLVDLPMKYDELIAADGSVIFQDPDSQFCMPKVYEELAFILENQQVPQNEMDKLIEHALRRVNLNVTKNQQINQLSGGMKQKLAVAGTLLQNSDTLFLDEPTAMLDVEATSNLWELLISLWHDKTVVIVEHKVEHIWQHVDRVILMDHEGRIVEQGSPSYIFKHCSRQLSDYGVWYPGAWEHAPEPLTNKPVHDVHFKFTGAVKRKKILYTVDDLTVGSAEWITLSGHNGSGKTTLLESMLQMIKYDGVMTYDNERLKKIKQAAEHFYLVYQNPELQFIQNSVYDEVLINYKAQAAEQTEQLLKLLQLWHVKDQHPYELSMGQKRRLSVATALSSDADMILLDEPTFGLDSHNTFQLIDLFKQRVAKGQTIIMVTHDPEIIRRYPTRRWNVEAGRLVEVPDV